MNWLWVIFWILLIILITGTILFIVGLEAPHKDKPDNTVNYDTFKWVGIAMLIFGGVGMLIWAYFKFRGNKSKDMASMETFQEPLIRTSNPVINDITISDCSKAIKNLRATALAAGQFSSEYILFDSIKRFKNTLVNDNPGINIGTLNAEICSSYGRELSKYNY